MLSSSLVIDAFPYTIKLIKSHRLQYLIRTRYNILPLSSVALARVRASYVYVVSFGQFAVSLTAVPLGAINYATGSRAF